MSPAPGYANTTPNVIEDALPDANFLAIRNIDDHFTEIVQLPSTGMALSEYTIP